MALRFAILVWGLLAVFACAPELSSPQRRTDAPVDDADEPSSVETPSELTVAIEPHGSPLRAPPILRIRLRAPADLSPLDPGRFLLVEGELSTSQIATLAGARPPKTILERAVPLVAWSVAPDHAVLAPMKPLERGARYMLVSGSPKVALPIEVASDDPVPMLSLVWPPEGRSRSGAVAVWCGDEWLPPIDEAVVLDPTDTPAALVSGIGPGDGARQCVHLEAPGVWLEPGERLLPPPVLGSAEEPHARIDPRALEPHEPAPPKPLPLSCGAAEIPFGPGCAVVADDRLTLRTPSAPVLWSIVPALPGSLRGVFASEGEELLLSPLTPSSTAWFTVTTVDARGKASQHGVTVVTRPAMAHLVINEVMANPIGPEPQQEWVEIYNDGLAPASLGGYRIIDVGGDTSLPAAKLSPGGYALIVNAGYLADGKYDPAPAPGALVISVPKLGKSGLANGGEPLELVAPGGRVVSSFPAIKTKQGCSAMRLDPKSLTAFTLSEEGGSTPGGPNVPLDG